jgi:hypothetical protein
MLAADYRRRAQFARLGRDSISQTQARTEAPGSSSLGIYSALCARRSFEPFDLVPSASLGRWSGDVIKAFQVSRSPNLFGNECWETTASGPDISRHCTTRAGVCRNRSRHCARRSNGTGRRGGNPKAPGSGREDAWRQPALHGDPKAVVPVAGPIITHLRRRRSREDAGRSSTGAARAVEARPRSWT